MADNKSVSIEKLAHELQVIPSELREAMQVLGFEVKSNKGKYVASGLITYDLINDGAETSALIAGTELVALSAQYSRGLKETATFILNYKPDVNSALPTESTIEAEEIELDELSEESKEAVFNARQAFLKRTEQSNRQQGDLLGFLVEADKIEKIQQGQERAWENPVTRTALENLMEQGTNHSMSSLIQGKPGSGKLKMNSLTQLLKPVQEKTIEAVTVPHSTTSISPIKPALALANGSQNGNGKQ
ncbi:MAG: hypothetical protein WBB28_20855 [Crinalium sp.]